MNLNDVHCKRMQKWKTRSPVSLVPFSNISCLQRDSSSMSMQICNTLYSCYNICNFCLRLLFLLLVAAVVVWCVVCCVFVFLELNFVYLCFIPFFAFISCTEFDANCNGKIKIKPCKKNENCIEKVK